MNIKNKVTQITVMTGIIWTALPLLGWLGLWYPALFLSVLLMALYLILGTARNGVVHRKMLFLILGFGSSWCLAFALGQHHAEMFMDRAPSFTILGFHPSFFWILLFYWLGGVASLSLGYFWFADAWLSKSDWDEFLKKIQKINAGE